MFKIAWHPTYVYPVPTNHRFPMEKYELLPQQLVLHGIVTEQYFFEPTSYLRYDFSIHCAEYLDRLFNVQLTKKEERASGFKQSKTLIDREIRITNGTIEGALSALKYGVAFNIAGGTHHAFRDRPEGFSLINDQVVASLHLLNHNKLKKILIIDLDVHQGNGTASMLQDESRVFTFSMHGANNYPARKSKSDLDIPLKDGTKDNEYLEILKLTLPKLILDVNPDFVFFLSGVDILKEDKLGRLSCTIDGCKQRDEFVFKILKEHEIPVMVTMGGGYSPDIKLILEAHCNTFKAASNLFY